VGKLVVGSSTFPEYQFGNWQYTKGYGTYTLNIQNSSNYNNELDVQSDLIIGDGGIGEFYHKSGDVKIGGNLVVGQNGATDAFTDSNGTHTSDPINGDGTYNLSNGTLQVVGSVYVGKDTGSKGTFTQTGGQATVGDTMTIATGSEASLSGGTLAAGNLTNNGTLNLFKAGLLTVGDTFTNNGTLFLDLDNYAGGSFITLANSTAVLNGTLQIDWHGTAQETTFTLLSAAQGFSQGSDLVFEFLNLPIVQNFHWEYTYTTNDVLLSLKSGPSPVPVPSTMVLLGSALTALAGCRRRRATTH
jgi:hypothetical protein